MLCENLTSKALRCTRTRMLDYSRTRSQCTRIRQMMLKLSDGVVSALIFLKCNGMSHV